MQVRYCSQHERSRRPLIFVSGSFSPCSMAHGYSIRFRNRTAGGSQVSRSNGLFDDAFSIRPFHQPLRNPPEIAERIANAPLTILIGHVSNFHNFRSTGSDRPLHRLVRILYIEVVRSWHRRIFRRCFTEHHHARSQPNLSVCDTIPVHMT
ncbi:hypothetical protein FGO68_gene13303 [Halteria grandinella]|uniref:Uncharacterized protein n=1 Tax=Halteria grandinella TaxID=5974 RepID=A0A8J8NB24_HALGN|nr:hypothetical protein FGO68_gene13303 [Halteria grandinella]